MALHFSTYRNAGSDEDSVDVIDVQRREVLHRNRPFFRPIDIFACCKMCLGKEGPDVVIRRITDWWLVACLASVVTYPVASSKEWMVSGLQLLCMHYEGEKQVWLRFGSTSHTHPCHWHLDSY